MEFQINKDTKIYGSFSNNPGNNGCIFFNDAFQQRGINSIYKSFYADNIENVILATKTLGFAGFALSMPFKVEVLKYLDIIDESANQIGAVNTVLNNNGILTGYNTDFFGVADFFSHRNINGHINIIGNGGFSKAIQTVCKSMGIDYTIILRNGVLNILKTEGLVYVNATPADIEFGNNTFIDLRPTTPDGKLVAKYQAIHQFKIYTGIDYENS
jgi:shikimate dehydrogenase